MKINFVINNYLLIWNLLYGPSISIRTHAFKQKLWLTYKKEYKIIESDSKLILSDMKNFIPDNNTLYDLIDGTLLYERLEKDARKHRIELMETWDLNKKSINNALKQITRLELEDKYNVVVLPPYMETLLKNEITKNIAWGMKEDNKNNILALTKIIFEFIKFDLPKYDDELDNKIEMSIVELAIINELYTRINKTSNCLDGNKELKEIKKEIYPYFLMYLGIDLEDTAGYMMRDNIAFDIEKYTNEIQLRKLNIYEFIDFVIRNKTRMLKIKKVGLEII